MPVEQNEKTVTLRLESGATAEIYYFGATVTSWKVDGQEKLFLSKKSSLDSTKPVSGMEVAEIRGGIPIVFPIFGPPPSSPPEYAALTQHGFVRTQDWTLESVVMDRPEGVSVRFTAPPPPSSFAHSYKLAYVVTLAPHQLSTDLHIVNTSDTDDFIFQALLHTYLAVPDASKIKITGLDKGVTYKDKTKGMIEAQSTGEPMVIDQEVDRQQLEVDNGDGSGYKVRFRGFEDCTVWNIQEEKGKKMADLEDGGWERYVCIEPGYVREFKSLKPGEEFIGQQIISVV